MGGSEATRLVSHFARLPILPDDSPFGCRMAYNPPCFRIRVGPITCWSARTPIDQDADEFKESFPASLEGAFSICSTCRLWPRLGWAEAGKFVTFVFIERFHHRGRGSFARFPSARCDPPTFATSPSRESAVFQPHQCSRHDRDILPHLAGIVHCGITARIGHHDACVR
jgi:hypothetical protein